MNKKGWTIVVVILALVLVWVVLANRSRDMAEMDKQIPADNTSTQGTNDAVNPDTSVSVDVGVSTTAHPAKSFTVTGSNFSFTPNKITVKKGDKVSITFVNSGGTHDWRLDEFNAATQRLQGGQQEIVTFVADKTGTFEYYCSVGEHRSMGMKGTLTVE